jgi:hypothetical protein
LHEDGLAVVLPAFGGYFPALHLALIELSAE